MTKSKLSAFRPDGKRHEWKDDALPGLWLTRLPSGLLTWSARFKFKGRDRRLTIGRWPAVDISTARKVATATFRQVALGNDPQAAKIIARRRARAGLDRDEQFGAVFERYLAQYVRRHLKPSTVKEIERMGTRIILPRLGRRELKSIEPREVKALIAAQAPTTANRVHSLLMAFFNWCKSELIIVTSPVTGIKKPTPERPRDRVLSDQEIKWFWRGCEELGFPFGYAFQLLLVTAGRRAEVGGMLIDELDQVRHTWTISGQRTKNGRQHVVTIAPLFKAILDRVPYHGEFVFGRKGPPSGWSKAKLRLDRMMDQIAADAFEQNPQPWRLHDLRRTAASKMAEIGVSLPVIERALNHVSESFGGLRGVYQRHEFSAEMTDAFRRWDAHLRTIID